MQEKVCKGCEWNTGKECTNLGSFEPYQNCCQRVLELHDELIDEKKTTTQLRKKLNETEAAYNTLVTRGRS